MFKSLIHPSAVSTYVTIQTITVINATHPYPHMDHPYPESDKKDKTITKEPLAAKTHMMYT